MTNSNERSKLIREQFSQWCKPKRGSLNPEIMTNPVWVELVKNEYWPHKAHKTYGEGKKLSPGWCFSRYGQSETRLSDGSAIFIGGEHEDHYDEDFYIYNDVIVQSPNGETSIYGYPKEVFPPTDSHSATLIDGRIYIIGCIGYPEQRTTTNTPVYVLDLNDYSISHFETSGNPPNWLYRHHARFVKAENAIYCEGGLIENTEVSELVENIITWRLCLTSGVWSEEHEKPWVRWRLIREDNQTNKLYEIGRLASAAQSGREDKYSEAYRNDLTKLKYPLNFAEYKARYSPPLDHGVIPTEGHRIYKISVEGVTVRFEESSRDVTITVEGYLPDSIIAILKAHGTATFSKMEATPYKVVEL